MIAVEKVGLVPWIPFVLKLARKLIVVLLLKDFRPGYMRLSTPRGETLITWIPTVIKFHHTLTTECLQRRRQFHYRQFYPHDSLTVARLTWTFCLHPCSAFLRPLSLKLYIQLLETRRLQGGTSYSTPIGLSGYLLKRDWIICLSWRRRSKLQRWVAVYYECLKYCKSYDNLKGAIYDGLAFEGKICGVSILRAGEVNFHELLLVWRCHVLLIFI